MQRSQGRTITFFVTLLIITTPSFSQNDTSTTIAGRIVDVKGQAMAYVNVLIAGSYDGTVSDKYGHFVFKTRRSGVQRLKASMMGYESVLREIELVVDDTVRVQITMQETLIELGEAVVTANAFSTGDEKGVTLQGIEVVTTPGAAADIFLAIKSFPGVAMVDEGSGLFVRGGDVSETVTLLDQATVVHPYKYESPTGGAFGTISPFLVKGTFFSTGGFSARYGNALSGVLAMESQDMPERSEYIAGLGLAAASVGFHKSIANNKLGIRFTGNRSFTDTMFRLNGRRDEFTNTPRGMDGNLSLIYRYSNTGRLKFFNFVSDNRLGVHVDQPSFDGVYVGEEDNRLHNLQWSEVIGGFLLKSSLSLNSFDGKRTLGNLNLDQRDRTYKLRTDAEKGFGERLNFATGFELERVQNRFIGEIPFYGNVLDPDAEVYRLDEKFSTDRIGGYIEVNAQLGRRWFANFGLRADRHNWADEIVFDPRFGLRHQLSKTTNLRFSYGIFHQFPQPYLYNDVTGNPDLGSQSAQHLIATYEYMRANTHLRFEGYWKKYYELVVKDNNSNYANLGNGYARGLDFFLKYGAFLQTRFNGWISYSFLQTERLQARDLAGSYLLEDAKSAFDITHNLTVVAKANVYRMLSAGLTYRYATGRPLTPIIAAEQQLPFEFYLPIEGRVNSKRLPSFQRLDTSLSLYVPFGYGNAAVFYLAISNLLNRVNVLDYDYSPDYSSRTPRTTSYRRFVYFGVSVTIVGN